MKPARVIAIAGPTCSGKSTLAAALAHRLDDTAVLALDRYYRHRDELSLAERSAINYDHPDALEHERFVEDLTTLLQGQAIDAPVYCFETHRRLPATTRFEATPMLIVEGTYALYWEDVRRHVPRKDRVFIDLSPEHGLLRRVDRDVSERGRSRQEVRERFREHVLPMAQRYLLPTKQWAGVVLDGQLDTGHHVERLIAELQLG